ncbi:hypothetical protein [Neptunicella marina]|uniref:Uncharacterized protein n=1 Tax=Neptunicella marina TaxID=2125989 RepID=A0A8J6IUZ4_9ALTE|nr:hypothetical protein [Neptunicella marina]MBC3766844.1 hypothetical protein [Neptunicella marina]
MSNQQFEQDLRNKIDQLDKNMQPQRDLWTGIEVALSEQHTTKKKPYLAIAASVMVVGLVGWLGLKSDIVADNSPQLVQTLTQQHQQQMQGLLVTYADAPALTNDWQQQLDELDRAADAIKQALAKDPNNPALLKMLQQVYQQQIDLVEKVHAPGWQRI